MPHRPSAITTLLAAAVLLAGGCGRNPADEPVEAQRLISVTTVTATPAPAEVDTVVLWLGPGLARRDDRDGSFLVDAEAGRLTHLDHKTRTWTSMTTDEVRQQLSDLAAAAPDEIAGDEQAAHLQRLLKVVVSVSEMDDEAVIDGYNCRRWVVEQRLGDHLVTTELWLTRDIAADTALLHKATRPALMALPGGQMALTELSRLDGVPVRATSLVQLDFQMAGRSETRLLAVETLPVARSHFAPPAGYRQSEESGE